MYEFLFGLFCGAVVSGLAQLKEYREVACQTEAGRPPTVPVPIRRRPFVPGELKNFWGKDS